MFDYYQGLFDWSGLNSWSALPSFGIMAMLLLNGVLERIFPERLQVDLGTLDFYPSKRNCTFLVSGLLLCLLRHACYLGLGWMLNAKAISIISERYHGKLVFRCLVFVDRLEVVGASILTLAVGQLLAFGWTATF